MKKNKTRIAAVADIHVGIDSVGLYQPFFQEISDKADLVLIGGDLTDHGLESEAQVLVDEARSCRIPIICVLGNHDHESAKQAEVTELLRANNIHVLDGNSFIVGDIGVAGVKGFGGGFDRYMLSAWGEKSVKDYVYESVNEALKLEKALGEIHDKKKIVLLHYAPVRQTVEGEPPEIFAYLGSTRLEESINRLQVEVVFHGHAHHGTVTGKTASGIPVFNVARPLLREKKKLDYMIYEV